MIWASSKGQLELHCTLVFNVTEKGVSSLQNSLDSLIAGHAWALVDLGRMLKVCEYGYQHLAHLHPQMNHPLCWKQSTWWELLAKACLPQEIYIYELLRHTAPFLLESLLQSCKCAEVWLWTGILGWFYTTWNLIGWPRAHHKFVFLHESNQLWILLEKRRVWLQYSRSIKFKVQYILYFLSPRKAELRTKEVRDTDFKSLPSPSLRG